MLTNDGRNACEIKSRIAMAKPAFNKKRRKKLVKCYISSNALYGDDT